MSRDPNTNSAPQEPTERWSLDGAIRLVSALNGSESIILRAIAAGESNAEIANRLGISEKAAEKRISKLYLTLGVPRRLDAAVVYTIHHVHHLSLTGCDRKK